jgi:hypothetical protein
LERGRESSHEIGDWSQAEFELIQLPIRKIAERELPQSKKGKVQKSTLVALVRAAIILGRTSLAHLKI